MTCEVKSFDELPAMLNANHLMMIFGLSKGKVYEILNSSQFPTLRFGKRLMVTKTDCLNFIEQNKYANKNR